MNKQQRLAGRLHCTAKIPRTTGSMPPSVCLNEFKQMEVQSWLVSVTVQSAARAMTLTRPRHWVTQHILDSVEVSAEMVSVTGRVTGTQSCCDTRCPVSLTSGHYCHAVTARSPDWQMPWGPLIGQWWPNPGLWLVSDCSLMIVISWVTFGHQVIPDRSLSPDYPVSEEDQSLEPLSRTHQSPILELNRKPDTKYTLTTNSFKSSHLSCKMKHGGPGWCVCLLSIYRSLNSHLVKVSVHV